ncbi:MAG: hypothetical protein GF411_11020 [Candidatus Lokiarchaeota archaeon]|nr:hypothetical protein [Candidatus Lokiarchaeota archaeon]
MDDSKQFSFQRYFDGKLQEQLEDIVVETKLELWLEDFMLAKFSCSPGLEDMLAIGYLMSSGLVDDFQDIKLLSVEPGSITLSSRNRIDLIERFLQLKTENIHIYHPQSTRQFSLTYDSLFGYVNQMRKNQVLHVETGGTHASMLVNPLEDDFLFAEDIGRLNSMDKVIGLAISEKWELENSIFFVTGRITSEMVYKAVYTQVPALCSLSVATDKGIASAGDSNITLIGSIKPDSFWLYNSGAVVIEES